MAEIVNSSGEINMEVGGFLFSGLGLWSRQMLNNKTVLVTGGTGLLGSKFVSICITAKHKT